MRNPLYSQGLLIPHMIPTDEVLVVGCGNSALRSFLLHSELLELLILVIFSEDINRADGNPVTSIDFSDVVIEEMKTKTQENPALTFSVMDMLEMDFEDGKFDVVLDKGALVKICFLRPNNFFTPPTGCSNGW